MIIPLLAGILWFLTACTPSRDDSPRRDASREVLYQVSTIDALLSGDFDGESTCGEIRRHGDFGIGTFNGLDGEMIQLEGKIFKIRSDGNVYPVPDSTRTPFASVTHFDADTVLSLKGPLGFDQLCALIDSLIPTENIFYAIKVTGQFNYVKARSVPRQHKPYRPLVEIVQTQPTFEYERVRGTLVGFRAPPYMKGLNVPGYHLHFITEDHRRGGHVLACSVGDATLSLDFTTSFHMVLPQSGSFSRIDLTQDKQAELEKVEK